MIIECPHCQTRLYLPEHATANQGRCPNCRQVFRADENAVEESVQAGSPESASASVTPKPHDKEEWPRAETRPFEGEDEHYRHLDSPGYGELVENAKTLARPAAYAMLAAFIITSVSMIASVVIGTAAQVRDVARQDELPVFFSSLICSLVFFHGSMLTFVGIGAKSLFTLGSRGLIVTAIVMNFIYFFVLCCGEAIIVLFGTSALDHIALGIALAMAVAAHLAAAVMAIRVLTFREVAEAYATRAGDQRRRRY